MANHCETCGLAHGFGYSPDGPSGPTDGVYCRSAPLALEADKNDSDRDFLDELYANGYVHIWRAEILLDDETDCQFWEPKSAEN